MEAPKEKSMSTAYAKCKELDKTERRAFLNAYFGGSDADYADYIGNHKGFNSEFEDFQ